MTEGPRPQPATTSPLTAEHRAEDPTARSTVSYRVVLPPGWARISLRDDPARHIEQILAEAFQGLPTDKYGPMRHELTKKLLEQIENARKNEGVDLFVPVATRYEVAIPASFVVALLPFSTFEVPPVTDVLLAFAAENESARVVEVDSAPAVRTERVVAGITAATDGSQFPTRRIDYLISIPQGEDNWMTVSFSSIGDGIPNSDFTNLMVDLFDAIMGTFRWVVELEAGTARIDHRRRNTAT